MIKFIALFLLWLLTTIFCWPFSTILNINNKAEGKTVFVVRSIFYFIEIIITILVCYILFK